MSLENQPLDPSEFGDIPKVPESKPSEPKELADELEPESAVQAAEGAAEDYDQKLEATRTAPIEQVVTSEFGKSFMELMEAGAYDEDMPKGEKKLAELTDLASKGEITKEEVERLRMEWDKIASEQKMGRVTEISKPEGEGLKMDDDDIDSALGALG